MSSASADAAATTTRSARPSEIAPGAVFVVSAAIMEDVDTVDLWWALYRRGVLVGTNALVALSTPMTDDDLDFAADAIVGAVETVRA